MSISKEEQIKRIASIMNRPEVKIPYYRFTFGKYKDFTLCHVFKNDQNYLKWIYNNIDTLPKSLEKFIQEKVMV